MGYTYTKMTEAEMDAEIAKICGIGGPGETPDGYSIEPIAPPARVPTAMRAARGSTQDLFDHVPD